MTAPIPDTAVDLIKKWEGFRANAYRDSVGVLTVGYGFTEPALDAIGLEMRKECSKPEATTILTKLLHEHYAPNVDQMARRQVGPYQRGALCSLAYNIGLFALEESTLIAHVQKGEMEQAAQEFEKWIYADGQVLEGLVRRREDERAYFESQAALYEEEEVRPLPVRGVQPHPTPSLDALLPTEIQSPPSSPSTPLQ